jgi:hypothetical protein
MQSIAISRHLTSYSDRRKESCIDGAEGKINRKQERRQEPNNKRVTNLQQQVQGRHKEYHRETQKHRLCTQV